MTSVSNGQGIRVLAVSRAMPRYVEIRGKKVFTSILRERSLTPLLLTDAGPEGNQTAVHTEHVLASSSRNYRHWSDRFGVASDAWPYTFWGENIVFDGLEEEDLPIGTLLHVGPDAILQVTSPRNPCFKLSWRIDQPDTVLGEILASGRTGFYLRVVKTGAVFDGDAVDVILPTDAAPSVARVAQLLAGGSGATASDLQAVLAADGLGTQCAGMIRQRLTELLDGDRTRAHRWAGWRTFEVVATADVADEIRSFELRAMDDGALASYRAGQHVQVRLSGKSTPTHTRAWSLSNYEDQPDRYRISVKRSGRGAASDLLHNGFGVGASVELKAPAGSFHLDRSSNHPTILISAGIGLTPLLAMLKSYALLGDAAPPIHWIHVTRNSQTYAHREEVDALLHQGANMHRHVRFTAPLASDRLGIDHDAHGRLTVEQLRQVIAVYRYPIFGREVELPGAAAEFYLCGPTAFEDDVRSMLAQLGAAATSIRSESFGARVAGGDQVATVYFAKSDITASWEAGATLLETAEGAGIDADNECRSGSCHRCAVAVLQGEVTYDTRPAVLPPAGMALICCSRPAGSQVTLDL